MELKSTIVVALFTKSQPLSKVERNTLRAEGKWYVGSSITNGAGFPANALNFFKMTPESTTANTPMKNAEVATNGEFPNTAPANKPIIGIFAPHGINPVVITVILRSFSCSMVRLAKIPGTPQPVATSIGMIDLPDKPNLRSTRSIINATRDIYPISSKIESNNESTKICGTKPSTAPTPATTPSMTSPYTQPLTPSADKILSNRFGTHSPNNTSFAQSVPIVPIENGKLPIAMAYIKNMIPAKIGSARIRFVTILSTLSERLSECLAAFFLTAFAITFPI